jgi:hypothetical protein
MQCMQYCSAQPLPACMRATPASSRCLVGRVLNYYCRERFEARAKHVKS